MVCICQIIIRCPYIVSFDSIIEIMIMKRGDDVDIEQILDYFMTHLPGIIVLNSWGETGIYYNPDGKLKRGIYLLTIKSKDGAHDKSSHLDRDGVFRLNIGIRKSTFLKLFGSIPHRPSAGQVVDMPFDFSLSDTILPHPVYAWMGWICVLNPSTLTFEQLKPLISEAYDYAKQKYQKR